MAPPLHRTFPDDDPAEPAADDGDTGPTRTTVAVAGTDACGFATASFAPWNARLTIRGIEVAPSWRGKGIRTQPTGTGALSPRGTCPQAQSVKSSA